MTDGGKSKNNISTPQWGGHNEAVDGHQLFVYIRKVYDINSE